MPELPEVEAVRLKLSNRILRRTIVAAAVSISPLRRPMPDRLAERLRGQRIVSVGRHGKLIIARTEARDSLLIHMGMTGRFVFGSENRSEADGTHDHLVLWLADGAVCRFNDRRRFGQILFYGAAERDAFQEHLRVLGPDALARSFSAKYLAGRLAGRKAPVKVLLMDQRVVAGLGNIYACEILYWAGVAPTRPAGSLNRGEISRVVHATKRILRRSIAVGGATLDDYRGSAGEMGVFDREFAVFARAGQPCTTCSCSAGVLETRLANRATYYCPVRQR